MRNLTVMIKPASSACQMRCAYCFYRDEAARRQVPNRGVMSPEVLERTVAAALAAAEGSCSFLFQGGEPTLAGLDFYRNFLKFEKKYLRPGLRVYHSLQTNGLAIDETWAAFLAENRFLTGLSLDGPARLHDLYRRDAEDRGTFQRAMRAAGLLRRAGAELNILCVVTGPVAQQPEQVYRFFTGRGFRRLQFIPCLDPLDSPPGGQSYSLPPQDYGEFLVRVFDLWFRDLLEGIYVSVRHLDNWIGILLGLPPEACNMVGRCSVGFTVESDGEVYPCDFYALDQWRLGNVQTDSLEDMAQSQTARQFVEASCPAPAACRACRYYPLCRNGCRRERAGSPEGPGKTALCAAYRYFFGQREDQLLQAARMIGARRG